MERSVIIPFQRKTKGPVDVLFEFPGRWNKGQPFYCDAKVQDHYANALLVCACGCFYVDVCVCLCLSAYLCVDAFTINNITFV